MQKIRGFLFVAVFFLGSTAPSWAAPSVQASCFVAQFKSLALKTHEPKLRAIAAEDWLKKNSAVCTSAQLSAIQINSPNWLGTALTMEIASILEVAIESKISSNPALMAKMYESAGKEGTSSTVTLSTPTPRAPVVQPNVVNGSLVGGLNYGTITGDTTVNKNTNSLTNTSVNNSPSTTVK